MTPPTMITVRMRMLEPDEQAEMDTVSARHWHYVAKAAERRFFWAAIAAAAGWMTALAMWWWR